MKKKKQSLVSKQINHSSDHSNLMVVFACLNKLLNLMAMKSIRKKFIFLKNTVKHIIKGSSMHILLKCVQHVVQVLLQVYLMLTDAVVLLVTIVEDRKSTRLNSSHVSSSYAVFCLKKKH